MQYPLNLLYFNITLSTYIPIHHSDILEIRIDIAAVFQNRHRLYCSLFVSSKCFGVTFSFKFFPNNYMPHNNLGLSFWENRKIQPHRDKSKCDNNATKFGDSK